MCVQQCDSFQQSSSIPVNLESEQVTSATPASGPYNRSVVKDILNIMYTNADILTNKIDELHERINELDPDVILVTEVFPKNCTYDILLQEFVIQGYVAYWNNEFPSAARGILALVKCGLEVELHPVLNDSQFCESLWLDIFYSQSAVTLIGCVYRSPNSSSENNSLLCQLIRDACHSRKQVVIAGDFNWSDISWVDCKGFMNNTSVDTTNFLECLDDCFLLQHVTSFTRARGSHTPSLIDLILTTDDCQVQDIEYLSPLGRSDHAVLLCSIDIQTIIHNEGNDNNFIWSKADYAALCSGISDVDWVETLCSDDVNDNWVMFKDILYNLVNTYVPVRRINVSKQPGTKASWMTSNTSRAVRAKKNAWRKFRRQPCDSTWASYKHARNHATNMIRQSKKEFEKQLAENIKQDSKSFWKYIRSKSKTKSTVGKVCTPSGAKSSSNHEAAETLNNYFCSVFTNEDTSELPVIDDIQVPDKLSDIEIKLEAIADKLGQLKDGKACGPDGLHPKLLKEARAELALPLQIIFSQSLDAGTVPLDWKQANVIPIHKKGSTSDPGNYRPVSLTSCVCKIMESIIRDHILKHLNENELLSDVQYGFRSKRSCSLQLLDCMERWSQILDNGNSFDVLYLDFSKAFDRVPHQRLLIKLRHLGINDKVLNWIDSFLSDRKQRVIVHGEASAWKAVRSGVPQGSVLGPVLFLMYVNDLSDGINSNIRLFADDAKCWQSIGQASDTLLLQESIHKLETWSNVWQLKFNHGKCHVMHHGRNNPQHPYQMYLHGGNEQLENIGTTEEEKDLGVFFGPNLNFTHHVHKVAAKANKMIGLIKRSFANLSKDVFVLLYKALVRPHLEYCSCVWNELTKRDASKLESVQRRATKLVPDVRMLSYPERLKHLGIPSLEYRRERADLVQVFKIVHDLEDFDANSLFVSCDQVTRGHKFKFYKRRCRTSKRLNSFSQRVVNSWNSLTSDVVEAPSLNIFKSKLNDHWKQKSNKFEPNCLK